METRRNVSTIFFAVVFALLLPFAAYGQDSYENDNSMNQAGVITLNDLQGQYHTFHSEQDEDWVKFYATFSQQGGYTIDFVSVEPNCWVGIELYKKDSIGMSLVDWSAAHSPGDTPVPLSLTLQSSDDDGMYYARIVHAPCDDYGCYYGENAGYTVRLRDNLAGETGSVIGKIKESGTGGCDTPEVLIPGAVVVSDVGGTAVADENGEYNLKTSPGPCSLTFMTCECGECAYQPATVSAITILSAQTIVENVDLTKNPNITQDAYEPDNTLAAAKQIGVNSSAQHRNFAADEDVDWVKVYLLASQQGGYTISLQNIGSGVWIGVEFYDAQGVMPEGAYSYAENDGEAPVPLSVQVPLDGYYYICVLHAPCYSGSDSGYDLRVVSNLAGSTGTVQGTVTAAVTGLPVPNALVSSPAGDSAVTDAQGFYSFATSQGTWAITAAADGYETAESQVTVVADQTVTVNFVLQSPTTLITLSRFFAASVHGKVVVKWVTESEVDNAGFNIYRASSQQGQYIKLNEKLIAAKGSPTSGSVYTYTDVAVKRGETWFYRLEDIDFKGSPTLHGPVSVTVR